ncbi:MAG: hypothetical protein WBQ94_30915 [Terracidiphilus sp.]
MLKPTNFRLRLLWGLLVGAILLGALLPYLGIHTNILSVYLNPHWLHFLVYLVVSFLPLFAWRRNTGLVLSMGMALPATGLEIIRAVVEARSANIEHMVINMLGIAAGILLGINILTLQSRMNQADI